MRDRLYINANYRDTIIKYCNDENILGIHMMETKDVFMLAAALGLNDPQDIRGKKDGYFRLSYVKTYDKSLYASILLGKPENKDSIDKYANDEICYNEAERCAETGFRKLESFINSAKGDFDLLEKRAFEQLEYLYQKNVASNL